MTSTFHNSLLTIVLINLETVWVEFSPSVKLRSGYMGKLKETQPPGGFVERKWFVTSKPGCSRVIQEMLQAPPTCSAQCRGDKSTLLSPATSHVAFLRVIYDSQQTAEPKGQRWLGPVGRGGGAELRRNQKKRLKGRVTVLQLWGGR